MSEYQNLLVEKISPGIEMIQINRPKALNALNTETLTNLKSCLEAISEDSSVRVVVLTGAGEKAFIAGADIGEMKDKNQSDGVQFARLGHDVAKLLHTMKKPTIAAVNGYALGGGTEMAIACDFILASETAVFGQPEVGLGITPGFGATFRLAEFVGVPRAKELIFSGRKIKAAEALKMGLVNHTFPQGQFREEVLKIAKTIAMNSHSAVATSKVLINELNESSGLTYKIDSESQEFGSLFGSHDQKEGMGAFVGKKKPKFLGLEGNPQ